MGHLAYANAAGRGSRPEATAAAATAKETELPKAPSKEPISHEHSYGFISTPELLAAAVAADDQIEAAKRKPA